MQIESFAGEEWELITQIPTQREDLATAVVENKVYLIGGTLFKNRDGPFGISTAEVYDTQTNTWRRDSARYEIYPYIPLFCNERGCAPC